MSIKIFDCQQNSDEWMRLRCGLPTASMFSSILAKGEGKMRRSYLLRLAGERITGEPAESFSNAHTERGHALEDEARDLYAFMHDAEPQRVGFVVNGAVGCSPDSFLGDHGALEIKTKLPALLIDCILKGKFPPEHKAQCQGVLWVAERDYIDIAIYYPKLPLFSKRAFRDEDYIANLAREVEAFNAELADTVERIRRYGVPPVDLGFGVDKGGNAVHPIMAG